MRSKLRRSDLGQYQLTAFIQRDLGAWIVIHADFALLVANLVSHVIAQHFLRFVIHRFAALLRAGGSVVVLQGTLYLVTGIPATQRTYHGRNITAPATAKLVADRAPATAPSTEPAMRFSS